MAKLGLVQLGLVEDGGATRAKRLADIYIKNHTNAEGKVSDPAVYQAAIDQYLSPFADDLTVASKMATFQNKIKDLDSENSDINVSLEDLRFRENAAWYISEDEVDSAGFRNPAYVAEVTSESLDMLVAETVETIQAKRAANKDTTQIESYLQELVKRSDRMRTFSNSLADGSAETTDGYGYYVDADPNTGAVRGASLMPTDVGIKSIGDGSVRTDTHVQVGSKKVPLYLPYVKDASGQTLAKFAGREYTGDTTLMSGSDSSDVILSDRNAVPFDGDSFSRGKVYRAYNGKANVDGTPRQDFYYAGHDNKVYKFADDDAKGKALLESLKTTGGLDASSVPRINPYTAARTNAVALPQDEARFTGFTQQMRRGEAVANLTDEAAAASAEAARLETRSGATAVFENAREAVSGFFSRKNRQSSPADAPARTGSDVIQQGSSFFRNSPLNRGSTLTP